MKIPKNVEQFEDRTALIIVAGRQDAIFYHASKGTLNRLDAFKIPRPHYSDNESKFSMGGRGAVISSGGVREPKDEKVMKDFLRELKQRTKKIAEPESIYLFAPSKIKNRITPVLPATWRKKVVLVCEGNYYYFHPLYVLKKISQVAAPVHVFLLWRRRWDHKIRNNSSR